MLAAANECLIAVDCAHRIPVVCVIRSLILRRRSGNCFLSRRAVSLTLAIVVGSSTVDTWTAEAQLLGYRTRPPVLLSLLAKCATALEHFPKPERWGGVMVWTYSWLLLSGKPSGRSSRAGSCPGTHRHRRHAVDRAETQARQMVMYLLHQAPKRPKHLE